MKDMNKSLQADLNKYARTVKGSAMVDDSHFYDFRQNIYGGEMAPQIRKMFLEGDGNELVSKACAVNSSSMLGYNFFHWVSRESPLKLFLKDGSQIQYTDVLYEVKIPVLKGTRAANMDIILKNDDGDILFIESKFLEYLSTSKFSISDTYKKESSYYVKGADWADFISHLDTTLEKQYWVGIKQEICHLIGLTNWVNGVQVDQLPIYAEARSVHFINLVFEPNPEEYHKEYESFLAYRNRYSELHLKLEDLSMIPKGITMSFLSYSDIWDSFTESISPELEGYLDKHYMKFAKKDPHY
jgi:hypothetical protein